MAVSESVLLFGGILSEGLRRGEWWASVVCTILATASSALGESLLTKARIVHENTVCRFGITPPRYKNPLYVLGVFFSYGIYLPLSAMALAFSSLSLIAPLQGLALVWHSISARIVLYESFAYQYGGIGNSLIIVGCVVCVVFGIHSRQLYTIEQLLHFTKSETFIIYASSTFGVLLILLLGRRFTHRTHLYRPEIYFSPSMPRPFRLRRTSAAMLPISDKVRAEWRRVCFTGAGGILGGMSYLLFKLFLELFKIGDPQYTWTTWVVGLLGLGTMLLQRWDLNRALHEYDAILVIPIHYALLVIFTTCSSILYFKEWKDQKTSSLALFSAGATLVVVGIVLRTDRRKEYQIIADDDLEDDAQLALLSPPQDR